MVSEHERLADADHLGDDDLIARLRRLTRPGRSAVGDRFTEHLEDVPLIVEYLCLPANRD
jgi:hypothetical protein